jgi:hypothetical protein
MAYSDKRAQTLLFTTVELQVLETSSHRRIETAVMSTISIGKFMTPATQLQISLPNNLISIGFSVAYSGKLAQALLFTRVELQVVDTSRHRRIETGVMSTISTGNLTTPATQLQTSLFTGLASLGCCKPHSGEPAQTQFYAGE